MMRVRGWSHGHSIGTGILFGVIMARHQWLLIAGAGVGGLIVGRLWYYEAMMAEALRRRVGRSRDVTRQRKAAHDAWARANQEIPF